MSQSRILVSNIPVLLLFGKVQYQVQSPMSHNMEVRSLREKHPWEKHVYTCSRTVYTSYGHFLSVAFLSLRASDCAATT